MLYRQQLSPMSADSLVFDMSSQSEGSPSIFVRKDWLSLLDNQNQSYVGGQSILDTSQLANSNKYMNYREAYITAPLLLTMTETTGAFQPATAATSADYAIGLKNWYGSIIHSFTLDYNGTTIIQQTPYAGLWNTFKLITSLSLNDIKTQGPTIGFYPDVSTSFSYQATAATAGVGVCNNNTAGAFPVVQGAFNPMTSYNEGLMRRQQAWNFDPAGLSGGSGATFGSLLGVQTSGINSACNQLWKSYIFNKVNGTAPQGQAATAGIWQVAITAQIYLKHLHSFFERVPLLKGVFMKLTFNINQSTVSFTTNNGVITLGSVNSPLGGVNPIMIASAAAGSGSQAAFPNGSYTVSLAVGNRCINSAQTSLTPAPSGSPLSGSVILNVPAYSFSPVFESSYLSAPIKKIVYTDIYQYAIINQISPGQTFNNLITNGIANIKSVLVLPFYQAASNGGIDPILSPFDPAGGGPTSPLCLFTQFNVQISGQNAIYNTERYSYEQWLNQLYGQNSVNGGMTDGLCSSLISQQDFEMEYCYYYVNCARMLPVEEAVPKSVNLLGTNMSSKAINLYIFIEYGIEVSVDVLTGARV
jgi:hypothetical protein